MSVMPTAVFRGLDGLVNTTGVATVVDETSAISLCENISEMSSGEVAIPVVLILGDSSGKKRSK
jgi:hypothetical protein